MESSERHLLESLAESNPTLRRLLAQHEKFHEEINSLERRSFRTGQEDTQLKELKLKKLNGLQRMLQMVDEFRDSESGSPALAC